MDSRLIIRWRKAWVNSSFRAQFIGCWLVIVLIAFSFPAFFDFIEARTGPQIHDVVLNLFPVADVEWLVFFFLYAGLAVGLYAVSYYPEQLLLTLETYCLVTIIRMLVITLVPLNPPEGYIPMREPVAQFVSNHSRIISKDLFFSGHMATICSVLFPLADRRFKISVLICTVSIGVLVLVQRVHYSFDVLVAPVVAFGCYYVAKKFLMPKDLE